jgi:hypothetical protein
MTPLYVSFTFFLSTCKRGTVPYIHSIENEANIIALTTNITRAKDGNRAQDMITILLLED